MHAKDIPDKEIVKLVKADIESNVNCFGDTKGHSFALRIDIIYVLKDVPAKVVNAKLRQCVLKGLLNGCKDSGCQTCRGEYTLTDKGRDVLSGKIKEIEEAKESGWPYTVTADGKAMMLDT